MTDVDKKQSDNEAALQRRRLGGFLNHMIGYFVVMIIIVPVNFIVTPDETWFVLPMVGWGSVLAVHVAWVMGLFDIFLKNR